MTPRQLTSWLELAEMPIHPLGIPCQIQRVDICEIVLHVENANGRSSFLTLFASLTIA